jgi:hypothetical protein
MPIRQLKDETWHAWTVCHDTTGQEVTFNGFGGTKGEALSNRDLSLATGMKAFPGLKSPAPKESPMAREEWDYKEARRGRAFCTTVIEWPDGKVSRRDDMDFNDRDRRRAFLSAVGRAMETGGRVQMVSQMEVQP